MKIRILSLILTLLALAVLAGCSREGSSTGSLTGTHTVTDHLGVEVEVPYEINRIAVCDIYPVPSVLAVFFDSADKIVGMPEQSLNPAKAGLLGELYPELLNAETGYIQGTSVNTEELLKLAPDVVFYSSGSPAIGEQLAAAGIPALAISADNWGYDAIETLNHWIELFDELFPNNGKSDAVRQYSEKVYADVQKRVADVPEAERQKAFFLFQYSDTQIMTSGKNFFGQWWAESIGCVNVGQVLETNKSAPVDMEQIYAWDPTLIFITNYNAAKPADLAENTVGSWDWSPVTAVQTGNVHKMPLGMYRSYTCGADTPVTLYWLAKTAYPALFEDVDVIAETRAYYREVFGIELTDAQAEKIFAPSAASLAVSPVES